VKKDGGKILTVFYFKYRQIFVYMLSCLKRRCTLKALISKLDNCFVIDIYCSLEHILIESKRNLVDMIHGNEKTIDKLNIDILSLKQFSGIAKTRNFHEFILIGCNENNVDKVIKKITRLAFIGGIKTKMISGKKFMRKYKERMDFETAMFFKKVKA